MSRNNQKMISNIFKSAHFTKKISHTLCMLTQVGFELTSKCIIITAFNILLTLKVGQVVFLHWAKAADPRCIKLKLPSDHYSCFMLIFVEHSDDFNLVTKSVNIWWDALLEIRGFKSMLMLSWRQSISIITKKSFLTM